MCFPIGFHVSRYDEKKASSFEVYRPMVPNELYSGLRAAFIWNGLCRLYICIFHHTAWEKNPPQHKILRLSGIPMRSRKSSGIVKKYTPSECVTLKAHTLINWSKISPIKIVRLDFVEDHIAHQVLHLQVQEDI